MRIVVSKGYFTKQWFGVRKSLSGWWDGRELIVCRGIEFTLFRYRFTIGIRQLFIDNRPKGENNVDSSKT